MGPDAPLLLLRADAGSGIGFGHAARLLALAEAWNSSGGRSRLITASPSSELSRRAAELGVETIPLSRAHPDRSDLHETLGIVDASPHGSWVALDGYHFDAAYASHLRSAGARVLRIDDAPRGESPCDALLDPNPGAEASAPALPSGSLALLGAKWAPLRPAFSRVEEVRPPRPDGNRLLISFGGADPADATSLALCALRSVKSPFEAVVVIGPDNGRVEALRKLAVGLPVRLESSADVPALMADSDLALIGGGVTMLEACATALPAIVVTVAENQTAGASALSARGVVRHLGSADAVAVSALAAEIEFLLSDAPARRRLAAAARSAVDGRGASRVVETLDVLSRGRLDGTLARVRPAAPEDAFDVWRIANDPAVRLHSFRKDPIPLQSHLEWYERRLSDESGCFYIVEAGPVVAGQVRYSRGGDYAEVHYSVLGAFRGKGLGTLALSKSRELACRKLRVRRLTGVVIEPNEPSSRSFLSAGWTRKGAETRNGLPCSVFEASCS